MKIGKITADELEEMVINKLKFRHQEVLVHAGIGEDSSVIDCGDEVIAVSSDPITGAGENIGYIAVHVTCNDVAAAGARPIGLQVVLLMPETSAKKDISRIMEEIHETAAELEVEILGGHTEILSSIETPLIIVTGIGKAVKDKYITSGGAQTGDDIILTKSIGIEGTLILASDYADILRNRGVSESVIKDAKKLKNKLSVMKEGLLAAQNGATGLHDITEGGVYGALDEMTRAADKGFELKQHKLNTFKEIKTICKALQINSAGLLSSGSMLITASGNNSKKILKELEKAGIEAYKIGKIRAEGKYIIDESGNKRKFNWDGVDELWKFMDSRSK